MLVAETCDRVIKNRTVNEKGSLPYNLGSFYSEFQIINYLGEDICGLDHVNKVVKIKPQDGYPIPREEDRCIIIQYRFCQGQRHIGSMAMETTLSTYCKMIIPYSVLKEEPIFVEEINAVLYSPYWHPKIIYHPHSKEYVALEHDKLRAEIGRTVGVYSPITIMANDPSGRISRLYIEINGRICSVRVTNFTTDEHETDVVAICIRGTPVGKEENCKIFKTTFSELLRQNPIAWTIEGFQVSSDPTWLEHKLEAERNVPSPVTVPIAEVKSLIEKAKLSDEIVIKNLEDINAQQELELKQWRKRYSELKVLHEDIIKGDYTERMADVINKKLHIEEAKVDATIRQAGAEKTTEKLKLAKESTALLVVVLKAAAVVIPIGIGLYIKYKTSK